MAGVFFKQNKFAFVCLIFTAITRAAAAVPTTQQWVDQLSSEDHALREAAQVHLQSIGVPAIAPLRTAAGDPRPEVSYRARRTLRRIQLFLLPGVPGDTLAITDRYLNADTANHRTILLNRLFEIQPQPDAVLARLAVMEQDDDSRRQILYRLRTDYRDHICRWLGVDDDTEGVLQLLDGAASMWGRAASADNAAALQLTGKAQLQIQLCESELSNGDSEEKARAARQLCFLYRVVGNSPQALVAARQSGEPSLVFLVLSDTGDWAAAAKETDDRWHDPLLTTAFRAAYQRLAGDNKTAASTMVTLLPSAVADPDDSFIPSKYFLLNDMPARGMELLTDRHPAAAFAMDIARGDVSSALDIAQKFANHPLEGPILRRLREDLLQTLGELPSEAPPEEHIPSTTPVARAWRSAVDDLTGKRYVRAAEQFGAMWEADHTHYDRLYLQGYALNAAGQNERGQKLMQVAEMIPLGDPLARWQFASQLDAAGLTGVGDQQRDFALRTGADFDEIGFSEIYNTRAAIAIQNKKWRAASEAIDRLCLIELSPLVQWPDAVRLLTIPALSHLLKSRDLRERGDLNAALKELQLYEQYLPASADMVLEWVPALDDLGDHHKADELFNSVYEKLNAICIKYPRSIQYQNQLAWMCACCGRRLDDALSAAQAAVKLKPRSWQTMDTLAEVNFRRGDRATAIALEKQASSLSTDPYLARQLSRFENAPTPSTTQPGIAPE